jgi:hypothetical protein
MATCAATARPRAGRPAPTSPTFIPSRAALGVSARMRRRAFGLRPVPSLPSRPFGFNPSRLRACGAARFACLQGKALRAIPAARCLAPLDAAEPAAPDRPGQRPAAMGGALANTLALAAAGCAGCVPSSTLAVPAHHVTKDGSRTTRPASLWSFHATPQDRRRKVRRGRSRLSSGG